MKPLLIPALILLSISTFSQPITGKWKPIFFSMDTLCRGDIKADTLFVNTPAMKEKFKDDKNAELSMQMMQFLFDALFQSFKEQIHEFTSGGKYNDTNTRTNKILTGNYIYDDGNKSLLKKAMSKARDQQFKVSWNNDQLVLTTEMQNAKGEKGKLEIVYEKVN